jgi:23S rRNA pseudouridine2605 synthase
MLVFSDFRNPASLALALSQTLALYPYLLGLRTQSLNTGFPSRKGIAYHGLAYSISSFFKMLSSDNPLRLQKYLADMGLCSRRTAEGYIRDGAITVNGKIAQIGDKITPGTDEIIYEGQRIRHRKQGQIVFALNKPKGFICSNEDPHNERTVFELLPKDYATIRLFCAGRLDKDSEGLVILTNDGDLANQLMHPSNLVVKRYHVSLKQGYPTSKINKLVKGVSYEGQRLKIEKATLLGNQNKDSSKELDVWMHHGKKREIRNLFMVLGFDVVRLKRYQIGRYSIKGMPKGAGVILQENDIKKLFQHEETI